MKIQSSAVVSLSLATLFGFAIGCSEGPSSDTAATHDEHADHDHAPGEHDHPTAGPHHGALVELGAEEFHAEVVHDDTAGVLTVYLLDAKAKEAAKSESAEILINVKRLSLRWRQKLKEQKADSASILWPAKNCSRPCTSLRPPGSVLPSMENHTQVPCLTTITKLMIMLTDR